MKKSILALIYSILTLFFPAFLLLFIQLIGGPMTMDTDGINYGAAMGLFMILAGSFICAIVGSILSLISYLKNKPDLILYAMIFYLVVGITMVFYPIFLVIPVLINILGFIAWKDVKRLEKMNPAFEVDPDL